MAQPVPTFSIGSRGKISPTRPPEPRKGRKKSRPNVTLVVGANIAVKRCDDKRLAVLGTENDMGEELRVGGFVAARQKPAPLEEPQGRSAGPALPRWGDFTRIPHPRLAPWATIFRPLRGLC